MNEQSIKFTKDIENTAFDKELQTKLNSNIEHYQNRLIKSKKNYQNLELARLRAANIKHKTLMQLDKYLVEFETNFSRNGGKVLWARHADEAVRFICKLLENERIKKAVKTKSATLSEISISKYLKKSKIKVVESNIGNFVMQDESDKLFHILSPAIHKSKEEILDFFIQKFQLPSNSTAEEIIAFTREKLNSELLEAGAAITGSNFLLADIGGVSIAEDEGNVLKSTALPHLHIVVAGIEKMIPSLDDLDLFMPLLATHASGELLSTYNSITTGPATDGVGPEQMVVILLDNGRSKLLEQPEQRKALGCIHCGACMNVCPVYKTIGGYSYNTTYSGPIGSVIDQNMFSIEEYGHLSFACTLCAKCSNICPMHIPIHRLLLANRSDIIQNKMNTSSERFAMKTMNKLFLKRKKLDKFSCKIKNMALSHFFERQWGPRRVMPKVQKKSFSQIWKEEHSEK